MSDPGNLKDIIEAISMPKRRSKYSGALPRSGSASKLPPIAWRVTKIPDNLLVTAYVKGIDSVNLAEYGGWALKGMLIDTNKASHISNMSGAINRYDVPVMLGVKCVDISNDRVTERVSALIMPEHASGNRMLNQSISYVTRSGMELEIDDIQGLPVFIKSRDAASIKQETQNMLARLPDYVQVLCHPNHSRAPNEQSWVAFQVALADWRKIDLRGMVEKNIEYGIDSHTIKNVARSIAMANRINAVKGIEGLPEFRFMSKVEYINVQGDRLIMPRAKTQKVKDEFNEALDKGAQQDDKTVAAFVTNRLDGVEAPAGHKWFVTENIKLPYMLMRDKDGVFVSLAELANDYELDESIIEILKAEANKMRALAKAYDMISIAAKNGRS